MSGQPKQPWAVLIALLIASLIGWVIARSGVLEATAAPQNLIMVLSKAGVALSALWLSFLVVSRFRTPKV